MTAINWKVGDEVEIILGAPYYHSSAGSRGFITKASKYFIEVSFYLLTGSDYHRTVDHDNPKMFKIERQHLQYVTEASTPISPDMPHYKVLRKISQLERKRKGQGYAF